MLPVGTGGKIQNFLELGGSGEVRIDQNAPTHRIGVTLIICLDRRKSNFPPDRFLQIGWSAHQQALILALCRHLETAFVTPTHAISDH